MCVCVRVCVWMNVRMYTYFSMEHIKMVHLSTDVHIVCPHLYSRIKEEVCPVSPVPVEGDRLIEQPVAHPGLRPTDQDNRIAIRQQPVAHPGLRPTDQDN